jgi:outer membrane protein
MKKIALMLFAGVLLSTASIAQKFGYVNSQELLQDMPEMKKANTDLTAFAKQYQDQLETMGKEFDKKGQEYQAGSASMTAARKEAMEKELQGLQTRIQEYNQSAQEKVQKRKEELYKPLLEKADKAIKDVAKEKGFDYVFDASAGSILYAKDSDNILDLVKAKLGIAIKASAGTGK